MQVLAALLALVHQSFALQIASNQDLATGANSSGRPHIIFVLADDLGFNGVGYTNSAIKTPFIDQLASEGAKLHFYYTAVYCAPSRFSFLTGRDGWKSEAGASNFRADVPIGTSTKYTMLPAAFKAAGYDTHMIGKWHQGFHKKEYMPRSRGFNTFYGILTQGTDHFNQDVDHPGSVHNCLYTQSGKDPANLKDIIENDQPLYNFDADKAEFGDDRYRSKAYELITTYDQKKPLFLYLSLQMPHDPDQVPEKYSSMYNTGDEKLDVYHGMMSHLDDSMKTVVSALKEAGMYGNSVIVFSSDNGAPSAKAAAPFNGNAPLKGNKGQVWEGAVRVPAFVAGGFLPSSARGRTLDGLVSIADWYATFAHIAGLKVDDGDGIFKSDSIDNWKYLSGQSAESARTEIIYHHAAEGEGPMSSIRRGKWKLVATKLVTDDPIMQLFDLSSDPGEEHDVKSSNPQTFSQLVAYMKDTYKTAAAMPWFYTNKLETSEALQERSCSTWNHAKGFIVPYATEADEQSLQFVKVAGSK